jgi:glycosyltransferase involved in cell wall biosynthesis
MSHKVVYIGPYRDGTGYSKSAIDHILALDAAGVAVVPRSVKMTPTSGSVPARITELEDNDLNNVDTVIQHNLPSEFMYKGDIQNVGIFAYETNSFPNCLWKDHLALMDKIVVSCAYQKAAVDRTSEKLANRTHVLMHPVDNTKFSQKHEVMNFDVPLNTLKFYTISEFSRRKNLVAMIIAYYATFSIFDNVLLIIKSHLPNRKAEEAKTFIKNISDDLKRTMGKFKDQDYYPRIALITDYLPEKHINSLHKTGDVFVTSSHGEAICLPMLDAIGFGKPVIAPYYSSFVDYCVDDDLLVDVKETVTFGVDNAPAGLYTSDEKWGNVSIPDLADKMKYAYENMDKLTNEDAITKRSMYIKTLNYETVGKEFKDILDAK